MCSCGRAIRRTTGGGGEPITISLLATSQLRSTARRNLIRGNFVEPTATFRARARSRWVRSRPLARRAAVCWQEVEATATATISWSRRAVRSRSNGTNGSGRQPTAHSIEVRAEKYRAETPPKRGPSFEPSGFRLRNDRGCVSGTDLATLVSSLYLLGRAVAVARVRWCVSVHRRRYTKRFGPPSML